MTLLKGKVWKFGDNINTDLLMPNVAYSVPLAEQRWKVFESIRPGWSRQVGPGEIIVGGLNFGTGSSRPAARLLRELGIVAVVADSVNGLFLRNCVNFGVIGLSCPGVSAAFEEGEVAEIDPDTGHVANATRGVTLSTKPLPPALVQLALAGGVRTLLRKEGYFS